MEINTVGVSSIRRAKYKGPTSSEVVNQSFEDILYDLNELNKHANNDLISMRNLNRVVLKQLAAYSSKLNSLKQVSVDAEQLYVSLSGMGLSDAQIFGDPASNTIYDPADDTILSHLYSYYFPGSTVLDFYVNDDSVVKTITGIEYKVDDNTAKLSSLYGHITPNYDKSLEVDKLIIKSDGATVIPNSLVVEPKFFYLEDDPAKKTDDMYANAKLALDDGHIYIDKDLVYNNPIYTVDGDGFTSWLVDIKNKVNINKDYENKFRCLLKISVPQDIAYTLISNVLQIHTFPMWYVNLDYVGYKQSITDPAPNDMGYSKNGISFEEIIFPDKQVYELYLIFSMSSFTDPPIFGLPHVGLYYRDYNEVSSFDLTIYGAGSNFSFDVDLSNDLFFVDDPAFDLKRAGLFDITYVETVGEAALFKVSLNKHEDLSIPVPAMKKITLLPA